MGPLGQMAYIVANANSDVRMSSDSPTPQYSFQSYSDAQQTSQTSTAVAAASSSTTTAASQPQTRQAAEEARKDRTLAEFLLMLDDYEPLVCLV